MLYQQLENQRVRCRLCAHRCFIAEGKRGVCSVRENRGGRLYSLVYGKLISLQIDPIEKKPLFHFFPGSKIFSIASPGCNFRCSFCQNWQISQITKGPRGQIVGENYSPQEVVQLALESGSQSIAYTYTEPTIFFEFAYDTAKLSRRKGLKNIFVSNGYQTPETIEYLAGIIDAINVDLKSFSAEYYLKYCGAKLEPILRNIKLFLQAGIWVEVTTLIVPRENDSPSEIKAIAEFLASLSPDIPWHISRFYPHYQMQDHPATPLETLYQAYEIAKEAGLHYVYLGNVPSPQYTSTFCPFCQALVVERRFYQVRSYLEEGGRCPRCHKKLPFRLK